MGSYCQWMLSVFVFLGLDKGADVSIAHCHFKQMTALSAQGRKVDVGALSRSVCVRWMWHKVDVVCPYGTCHGYVAYRGIRFLSKLSSITFQIESKERSIGKKNTDFKSEPRDFRIWNKNSYKSFFFYGCANYLCFWYMIRCLVWNFLNKSDSIAERW